MKKATNAAAANAAAANAAGLEQEALKCLQTELHRRGGNAYAHARWPKYIYELWRKCMHVLWPSANDVDELIQHVGMLKGHAKHLRLCLAKLYANGGYSQFVIGVNTATSLGASSCVVSDRADVATHFIDESHTRFATWIATCMLSESARH